MAKTLLNPCIGQRVYRVMQPTNPGIVTEVIFHETQLRANGRPHTPAPDVRVMWLKGESTVESSLRLNDFQGLVDDHRKKLETHVKNNWNLTQKLEALEALKTPEVASA